MTVLGTETAMSSNWRPPGQRALPHNPVAEKAVLGRLLLKPADTSLAPDDFSDKRHAHLFRVILDHRQAGRPADGTALMTLFSSDATLLDLGGAGWLMEATEAGASLVNFEQYQELIRDLAKRRSLMVLADDLITDAADDDPAVTGTALAAEYSARLADAARWEAGSRFDAVDFNAIATDATADYVVKGILDARGFFVCYGESGCGKTFFVADLSLRPALGWEWRGRRVKRCAVVYIAAEGGVSMKRRLAAFRTKHPNIGEHVPFVLIPRCVNLLDPAADTGPLIREIEGHAERLGMPAGLVIVDTVSRALAGGNENGSDDMGAFVTNVDRIRAETGAHVCAVHHSGKDTSKGARGHSLLRAAADTEIEVVRDPDSGTATATVRKQRDGEIGAKFCFDLETVVLGTDSDGDEITSCVVVPADVPAAPKQRATGQALVALQALRECIVDSGETVPTNKHVPANIRGCSARTWRHFYNQRTAATANTPDAVRVAFKRASDRLQAIGTIGVWGDWVWING